MRRKLAVTLLAVNLILLSQVGWSCDTPVTPKSQCAVGQTKQEQPTHGSPVYFVCHNNEWSKVACLKGMAKNRGGHHYTCRDNKWVRDN